ncbi:hypothetical protein ABPG73_022915 [Tetrahymena malaccensis]
MLQNTLVVETQELRVIKNQRSDFQSCQPQQTDQKNKNLPNSFENYHSRAFTWITKLKLRMRKLKLSLQIVQKNELLSREIRLIINDCIDVIEAKETFLQTFEKCCSKLNYLIIQRKFLFTASQMSIADTEIIDTRYNQGGAFKSKEWEQVMKKQFQEEECLWNDSQLNINGGKEFSLNQTKIEVKRIDNELIDIIEDKQLQQRLSVSQVSRRYRLSMKLAKVELNRQKQMAAFKNKDCETSKINELIENYPQFVSNIEMLTKIKIRMKQFYKSFTTIYRSRLLNRDMRIQINDKSDIIENKQHWLMKIEKSFSKISILKDLQSQVNIYLQQYYENDFIDEQLNKQKVLDKLPTDLQQNLKREQFQGIINQIDCIFNKLLSQKTLQDLSQYIIEEFYFPNETLNFNKKQSLIFITQGEVQVFQNNQTLISQKNCEKVGTLSAGKQFGLVDFISGISSEVIVKSTMFTKIVKINREDFVNVVKKDDLEYQKFCELKDNINLYEQMKDLNLKCNFCQSYCHYDRNCNLINIDKKQLFLNQIFVQKTTQKRSLFKRHQNKNSNPLLIQCFINNQAQQFIYSIKKLKEIHLINQYNLTMTETDESQSEKEESSDLSVLQKQESEQRNSEYLRPASIIIPQKSDLYNRMQSTSVQNQQNKHSFKDLDDQQKGQEFCQSQKQDFHSEKFIVQNIEPIRQNSSNLMNEMRVTFRDIKIKDEADFQEFSDEKNESQVQASSIKKQQTLATKRQQLNDSKLLQSKLNAIFDSLNSGQKENLQQQIKEFATTYSFFKQIFRCNSNVSNANQIQDFKFKIPQNYIIDIGFDQHKDFENYFPSGNLKEVISRISKQLKKKGKKALKTNLKKEE